MEYGSHFCVRSGLSRYSRGRYDYRDDYLSLVQYAIAFCSDNKEIMDLLLDNGAGFNSSDINLANCCGKIKFSESLLQHRPFRNVFLVNIEDAMGVPISQCHANAVDVYVKSSMENNMVKPSTTSTDNEVLITNHEASVVNVYSEENSTALPLATVISSEEIV